MGQFERTEMLLGQEGVARLRDAKIAIFGVGGVGGYVLEALLRSGAENISVFDNDTVSESNINRQILATRRTLGIPKTEAAEMRARDINPEAKITSYNVFYTPENAHEYDLSKYDYIVDAIDTVKSKLELITRADALGVRIISSMGTGNKLDPTRFEIADIYKTSVCPLARVMRTELRRRGVKSLKVLYSKEEPIPLVADDAGGRHAPASCAFVPSVAGLIIAGEVIRDIAFGKEN